MRARSKSCAWSRFDSERTVTSNAARDWVLATEQSGFSRHFAADALPVSIGAAAGADIHLAGVTGSLQIGKLDDVFFVQPGRETSNLRVDGELVRGSRKLTDGSVISLDTARLLCRFGDGRLTLTIEGQVTAGDTTPRCTPFPTSARGRWPTWR